ncbi:MAG: RNA polymerase sigma factor [Oscillospiraceae bacterium]
MEKERAKEMISRYRDKIFGFSLEKLRSISSAEELAADIVCEVYSSFLKAKEIINPDGYVYRIASNVYAGYIRRLKSSAECMDITELALPFYDDGFEKDERSEEFRQLRSEIGFLSERQRSIIYMFYYENKSAAEIARQLDISVGTVKWHLSDARSTLKEELTMEKYNDDLAVNPIEFYSMGHDGCPGAKGDTADIFDTRLKQNIAWSCYFTPLTIEEIARKLNVPCAYAADEMKILEEYGYIDRLDNSKNPRYRTNMFITDCRTFDGSNRDMCKEAAEIFCEELYPQVFADFDSSEDNWGFFCDGNDKNFMKYTLVMLCTIFTLTNEKSCDHDDLNSFRIKRPDGGYFIAHAGIANPAAKEPNPYWCCGIMSRNTDDFSNLQLDCRFSGRSDKVWRDNLDSDWQYLYDFIKKGKGALAPENYKRLCDKGYICNDKVQIMSAHRPVQDIIAEKVRLPESLAEYSRQLDKQRYDRDKEHYPEHMRPLVKLYCENTLYNSAFVPYLIEKMLEKGMLGPLTDIQKKSVFSVFIYN